MSERRGRTELGEDLTEDTLTDAVVASFAATPDARLREVLDSLVRHLHAVVREVEPTIAEWETAVDVLTRTGQTCTDTRQEFVLLSDVLGISALVENINHRKTPGATEATVLGPFHMTASPVRASGELLDEAAVEPCVVTGRVLSITGEPLAGAVVDVWQADEEGFYDVQRPDVPAGTGRGLFTTDAEGSFWFRTVVPRYYPIPTDGPVGQLLAATARHPYRPAHIHFIATAADHVPVTTHIFVADSPYLDSDAVFAVKRDLVRAFDEVHDERAAADLGVTSPFRHAQIDLVLDRTPR